MAIRKFCRLVLSAAGVLVLTGCANIIQTVGDKERLGPPDLYSLINIPTPDDAKNPSPRSSQQAIEKAETPKSVRTLQAAADPKSPWAYRWTPSPSGRSVRIEAVDL